MAELPPVDPELTAARPAAVAAAAKRGQLKVYLGATPGSGKTFAMLHEGRERRAMGEDVVVGFVETHGRPRTAEAIGRLEVVPRLKVEYRGTVLEDMDLDAVIARRPHVALIDELAHTNAPGLRHAKRWEDVEEVRDAGIDVITTLNVQHLESVKDVVEHITGITIRETLPDRVLDGANDVRFIDITPEALRKRMKHGNVYPLDRVDAALGNFFRPGNLAALREIGLQLVCDRLDAGVVERSPEDVLVAVSGDVGSSALIRRGVRIARRFHGFCTVVHVTSAATDGDAEPWRSVAEQLQCRVIEEAGAIAKVVEKVAHDRGVRHVVFGESHRSGVGRFRPGVVDSLVADLPDLDLHVIARWSDPEPPGDVERPSPYELLRRLAPPSPQAQMRLYLGYARGCGTSTALFAEGARRLSRGTDVVVAAGPLDLVPPELPVLRHGEHSAVLELDVERLLARNPDVVCVDDLSRATTTGEQVADEIRRLLRAGIVVLGTVTLTDLESVARTLSASARAPLSGGLLSDSVLDVADEIELIDVTPEDLQDRLRQGEVLPLSQVASALQTSYRLDVLQTLRELAFRRVAQHSDRRLLAYLDAKRIRTPWESRPRVLLCIAPRAGGAELVERTARLAAARGEGLTVLSVRSRDHDDEEKRQLGEYASLAHQLGAEFVTVYGTDVPATIARFAGERYITEVVLRRGPRRSRTIRRLIHLLSDVDVHILAAA